MQKADYPELVRNNRLDLWTCLYFKILPTDERFQKLRDETKVLLFTGFMEMPTPEQMKEAHDARSTGPSITEADERNFRRLGYSTNAIKRIKEQLSLAGLE